MNEQSTRELLRSLTADLPVGAAPITATRAQGRRWRKRRMVMTLAAVAAVAAGVLAPLGLVLHHDRAPDIATPVRDPLGYAWWSEGTLHLASGPMSVPGVVALVQVPSGAVVLTDDGEVRRIDNDRSKRDIGRWYTGTPPSDARATVRADDDGRLVWLNQTQQVDAKYTLVVYDLTKQEVVATHSVPTGFHAQPWLNEFEDGVVYWDAAAYGQRSWDISTDKVTTIGTGATYLLAVENDLWATVADPEVGGFQILSRGKRLWSDPDSGVLAVSPDGATLVTIGRLVTIGAYSGPLRLRDSHTGQEVAGEVRSPDAGPNLGSDGSTYLDDRGHFTYVRGTEAEEAPTGAPYKVVSCDFATSRCTTVVENALQLPLLPAD